MKVLRVYADTSVFGGIYDDEFEQPSLTFFEQVKNGQFILVTSAVVHDELAAALSAVRDFFEECCEETGGVPNGSLRLGLMAHVAACVSVLFRK